MESKNGYPEGCGDSDAEENPQETVPSTMRSPPGNSRKARRSAEAENQKGTGRRKGAALREESEHRRGAAPRRATGPAWEAAPRC